jgi:peptidoglycan/LPS O-acetylase OafA/YrhL
LADTKYAPVCVGSRFSIEDEGAMTSRIAGLDLLRGLAAISVVLFHFTIDYPDKVGWIGSVPLFEFPWGAAGVRVFFIISGLVIFISLNNSRNIYEFFVSRFARLYPAYILAIFLAIGAAVLFEFKPRDVDSKILFANLTMMPTLFGFPHIIGPCWTLQREVLFYIMMSCMYFSLGRERVIYAVCGWVIISIIFNLSNFSNNYYSPKNLYDKIAIIFNFQFSYLFSGGIIMYYFLRGDRRTIIIISALISVIAAGVSEFPTNLRFDYGSSLKYVVYGMVVLFFAAGILNFINYKIMYISGAMSYSLYLIHENTGYLMVKHLQIGGVPATISILIALCLSVLVASIIALLFEKSAGKAIRNAMIGRSCEVETVKGS